MYRVLIADDEPSVVKSLNISIDWGKLGLDVAACVSSGQEVLAFVKEEKIDIAILDIRMPGMNGLELCEYLKKQDENLQVIFISGYAEFSYAQKAINYGALGYCLKPLEYDQLTRLLLKACKQLDKENGFFTAAELLDAIDSGKSQEVSRILSQMGFQEEVCFAAVTAGESRIELRKEEGIVVELGRGQYGYILHEPLSESKIRQYLDMGRNTSIGYKKHTVAIAELKRALADCSAYAYQFFVEADHRVCCGTDNQHSERLLMQVTKNVEQNRWGEVCDQLALIEEKYCRFFNIRSATRLCNIIHTGSLFREETNDYYIYEQKQLVSEYGSFSEMLKRLQKEIQEAGEMQEGSMTFSNTAFMKLMRYIGENYRSEISLTSAGDALHMSPNYVSQLFKKETGTTFVHYITQLRVEEAMKLLTTTKRAVTEIAAEAGFHDYFYFLKTFKKITGKTPSQYREEN